MLIVPMPMRFASEYDFRAEDSRRAQAREAESVDRDFARAQGAPEIAPYSARLVETPQPEPSEWQLYIDQRVGKFVF